MHVLLSVSSLTRSQMIVDNGRRLGALKPDVLKLEFPVDCRYDKDETIWQAACTQSNVVKRDCGAPRLERHVVAHVNEEWYKDYLTG